MGLVRTEIELVSADDLALHALGHLSEELVKRMNIIALVDSGAYMLVISETVKNQLRLRKVSEGIAILADGTERTLDIVGPVEVRFRNRRTNVDALVMPGDVEVLLGAIPLEGLDVIIDPKTQTLTLPPERPYIAGTIVK